MKLRIVFSSALLLSAAALFAADLRPPTAGFARYADGSVRALFGLEANLVLGPAWSVHTDAASFSASGSLIAAAGKIQLLAPDQSLIAEYDSADRAPLLNLEQGLASAIAWLPSEATLIYWSGAAFAASPIAGSIPGAVSSIRLSAPGQATLLSSDARGQVFETTIAIATGNITSTTTVPGATGPAIQQGAVLVFHDANGIQIESPNGARRTLPLPAPSITFERMSADWIHIASHSTNEDWALHVTAASAHLSRLPAPPEVRK